MNDKNAPLEALVYIALGTNLGDRLANLRSAIQMFPPSIEVLAQSPIYQTPPWGYKNQPEFLNQVVFANSNLSPKDLLKTLKQIETQIGRTPTFQFGPRVVDLDILFYGDLVVELDNLQIPHPRLHERAFVLVPLNDLNPNLMHPVCHLTVEELLLKVDKTGITQFSL